MLKRRRLQFAWVLGLVGLLLAWRSTTGTVPNETGGHWQKAERQTLAQLLQFKGTLLPVSSVNIVAPIDGRLTERSVQFGDKVLAGQLLAHVESAELRQQLRDAEIAVIRAEQDLQAALKLEEGSEYQGALRRSGSAEAAVVTARRRAEETQMLYDKGIVPRAELEGARQEQESAVAQLSGARDELVQLTKKRSNDALRILQLDLQNRRERLVELRNKLEAQRLVSPMEGVVLYPMGSDANEGGTAAASTPRDFKPGSYVTTRDVILSVGDTTSFMVKVWVEESELQGIELHQSAQISIGADSAQVWNGKVERISSQARTADQRGPAGQGPPEFEVQVLVRPPAAASARVGASVKVKLEPVNKTQGWFVPLAAISWGTEGEPLLRIRGEDGRDALRPVVVGRTTVDTVELRSGLDAKSEFWVPGNTVQAGKPTSLLRRVFGSGEDGE